MADEDTAGQRLGKLISSGFLAAAYGSVGLTFAGFAVGMRGDSGDSTKDFSTALVQGPLGIPALIALGLTVIGVAGHAAKGIALILAGLLFVVAAAKNRPGESTGLDGSLKGAARPPCRTVPAGGHRGRVHQLWRLCPAAGQVRSDVASGLRQHPSGRLLAVGRGDYR